MKPTPKLDKCIKLFSKVKHTLDEALDRAVRVAEDKEMGETIKNANTPAEGMQAYYLSKYQITKSIEECEEAIRSLLDKDKEFREITRGTALLYYILFPERTHPDGRNDVTSTKTKKEAFKDLTDKDLWTGGEEYFDEVFEVLKMDKITIEELRNEFKVSCGEYSKIIEYVDSTYIEHNHILSERIPAWASLLWVSKKDIAEYHRRVNALSEVGLLTTKESETFYWGLYRLKETYNFVLNHLHVMYDRLIILDSSNLNKENKRYIKLHENLSGYISGGVHSFIHIMKYKVPDQEKKMEWNGAKDEAYMFSKHFDFDMSKMNKCFNFGKVKLDSNNKPKKGLETYSIHDILTKYDNSIK